MTFPEKLDLLMTLTRTSNSTMSDAVGVDPSFISRLRRGQRLPSEKTDFSLKLAAAFAKTDFSKHQKAAIAAAIHCSIRDFPQSEDEITTFLQSWLSSSGADEKNYAYDFLKYLSSNNFNMNIAKYTTNTDETFQNGDCLFGVDGKKHLITYLLNSANNANILIFTNEDLSSETIFLREWYSLLRETLTRGNKIKIIHHTEASIRETAKLIKTHLPLYSTGNIETYYYPKNADTATRRTLLVVPSLGAVVSNSIGDTFENAANFIYTDRNIVVSFLDEFNALLDLSHPFANVYTKLSGEKAFDMLESFERENSETYAMSRNLPTVTLKADVAWNIIAPLEYDMRERIIARQHTRAVNFEEYIKRNKYTALLPLSEMTLDIPGSNLLHDYGFKYATNEYKAHLANTIRLLKEYENFSIIPIADTIGDITVIEKAGGVIIVRNSNPAVMIKIPKDLAGNSFDQLMQQEIDRVPQELKRRSAVIRRLEKMLKE